MNLFIYLHLENQKGTFGLTKSINNGEVAQMVRASDS